MFALLKKNIFHILLLLASIALFYSNLQNKDYNWDLPGYLGSSYLVQNVDKQELLSQVYSSIQKQASEKEFKEVIGNQKPGNWRFFISQNSTAFYAQIPYYSIKVFYIFLIYFFQSIGFSGWDSVIFPNLISYFISGFLLFAIFNSIFNNKAISFFLCVILLLIPPFRDLATSPTPDIIIVLLVLWLLYSFLKKHELYIQSLILLLVIFTRPDYIIFSLTYLASYFILYYLKTRKINFQVIFYGLIFISCYYLILTVNNYPGWKDVFYDTFIQRRNFVTGTADFSFQEYRKVIFFNIVNFKRITCLSLLLLVSVFSLTKDLRLRVFACMAFFNIFLKFIFFPSTEPRFYVAFILFLFIILIFSAKQYFSKIQNLITLTLSKRY